MVTPIAPLDRTSPTFRSDVDVFFGARIPNFVSEVNALAANLNSIAAGGAYALPYVFHSTASGAVGNGVGGSFAFLANNSNLFIDFKDSRGNVNTGLLANLTSGTSAIKATIRAVKQNDPSTWVIYNITGPIVTDPSGLYLTCPTALVAYSTGFVFTEGDPAILYFQRTGDKGDQGPTGTTGYQVIASFGIGASIAAVNFANLFTADYGRYVIYIEDLMLDTLAGLNLRFAVGGAYDSGAKYTPAGTQNLVSQIALSGGTAIAAGKSFNAKIEIYNALGIGTKAVFVNALFYGSTASLTAAAPAAGYTGTSPTSGFQLFPDSGNITTGTVRIYGVKNTL